MTSTYQVQGRVLVCNLAQEQALQEQALQEQLLVAQAMLPGASALDTEPAPADEVERVMRREMHAIQQRHARSAGARH